MSEDESVGSNIPELDIMDYIDVTPPEEPPIPDDEVEHLLADLPEVPDNVIEIPIIDNVIPLNAAVPDDWNEWTVDVVVHKELDGLFWDGNAWLPMYNEYVWIRYMRV